MIVDDADRDLEMTTDPFLEAGIDIPRELPYQTPLVKRKHSFLSRKSSRRVSQNGSVSSLAKATSSTAINILASSAKKTRPRRNKSSASLTNNLQVSIPKTFPASSNTGPVLSKKLLQKVNDLSEHHNKLAFAILLQLINLMPKNQEKTHQQTRNSYN